MSAQVIIGLLSLANPRGTTSTNMRQYQQRGNTTRSSCGSLSYGNYCSGDTISEKDLKLKHRVHNQYVAGPYSKSFPLNAPDYNEFTFWDRFNGDVTGFHAPVLILEGSSDCGTCFNQIGNQDEIIQYIMSNQLPVHVFMSFYNNGNPDTYDMWRAWANPEYPYVFIDNDISEKSNEYLDLYCVIEDSYGGTGQNSIFDHHWKYVAKLGLVTNSIPNNQPCDNQHLSELGLGTDANTIDIIDKLVADCKAEGLCGWTWEEFQNYGWVGGIIRPGDNNEDGTYNVLDIVALVTHILNGSPSTPSFDTNGDLTCNVLDVVVIVNVILGSAPAPEPINSVVVPPSLPPYTGSGGNTCKEATEIVIDSSTQTHFVDLEYFNQTHALDPGTLCTGTTNGVSGPYGLSMKADVWFKVTSTTDWLITTCDSYGDPKLVEGIDTTIAVWDSCDDYLPTSGVGNSNQIGTSSECSIESVSGCSAPPTAPGMKTQTQASYMGVAGTTYIQLFQARYWAMPPDLNPDHTNVYVTFLAK